jgi:hypothetical protein
LEGDVLALLQAMSKDLGAMLSALDVSALQPSDAVRLLGAAGAVERRASALKTLLAERAAEAGAWAREGYRSPEAWLAQTLGSSYGQAAATLEASAKLAELPAIDGALRAGELSAPQLELVATAATADNEDELVAAAQRENVGQLRKTCARAKAKARSTEDEAERAARVHKARCYRSWSDKDGAYRFEGKTTAAVGARLEAAIGAEADNVFKAAYAEGRRESARAYRADALANLVCGGGARVDTTVVIRVDAQRLAGGEGTCETTSTGPVPVEEALGAILAGAFVKVVARRGVDITKVAHVGRRLPAELKTAVFERDGYACVRPGCGAAQHLEVHHYRVDFARGGATAYWNLATVCSRDHDLITVGGHRLAGRPGRWTWIPPP